jgi:hypothetical protein
MRPPYLAPEDARPEDSDLLDAHHMNALSKLPAVDRIAIAQQILGRAVPRKGFHNLLRRPMYRRILRDVEVENSPSRVCQDDEQ